jgi:DNA polymerase (family X)
MADAVPVGPPGEPPGNDAIAAAFAEIAMLLELTGGDAGRARSYAGLGRTIEALPRPAVAMLADGTLASVKGIGPSTVARVRELAETGRLAMLDELRAQVPPGVLEILRVPGLGAKRVRAIWQSLGVTSIAELEYACLENRLRDLDGFGDKTQANVIKGIGFLARSKGLRLLSTARTAAERCLNRLQRDDAGLRLAVAGAVRRMQAVVEGVELVATAHDPAALLETFATMTFVAEVRSRDARRASVTLEDGTPVSLSVVDEAAYFAALFVATGSREHVDAVAAGAAARGFRLTADGLFEGRFLVRLADEEDVYRAAGLPFVPPELRESREARPPPDGFLEARDVRGVLHAHTTWSDGSFSVRDMAERAAVLGFSWFAVCDHSMVAVYARGLDPARLEQQWAEIDALNASGEVPIPVLKGIETDILPDGSLDLPEEVLSRLDVVVGSVHSAMKQSHAVMTERLVRAVSNPWIHVLGHPTGRLLLGREGADFDVERVLDACAEHGTAVELNASPHRLDLDERWLPAAVERGVKVAIDPDAHDVKSLEDVVYGVGVGRRARLRAGDVLTTLDVDAFRAWCARKRGRPAPPPWPRTPSPSAGPA